MMQQGILVHIDRETGDLTLFDLRKHMLHTIPAPHEELNPSLGKFYTRRPTDFTEKRLSIDPNQLRFYITNLRQVWVSAKTWAVSPKTEDLPDELKEKYDGKIWSPYLGWLNDLFQGFKTTFSDGKPHYVEVRYSPEGPHFFRIVQTLEAPCDAKITDETPWDREINGEIVSEDEEVLPEMLDMKQKVGTSHVVKHALCFKVGQLNNMAHLNAKHGSKPTYNLLFTTQFGAYRDLTNTTQLGVWYEHFCRDDRKKESRQPDKGRKSVYNAVTALKPFAVPAPLETMTNEYGQVQVTTSFTFDPDMFETEENRILFKWDRISGMKKDAHFWDKYLGRVEFGHRVPYFVVKRIEDHKHDLQTNDPNLFEMLKSEPIIVTVHVVPQNKHYRFINHYPKRGYFFTGSVESIRYETAGGPVIYVKEF